MSGWWIIPFALIGCVIWLVALTLLVRWLILL